MAYASNQAELAGARIPMQVDIGFGDAVYPEPELASFPVLLPMEAPIIRAYPREARIAEKFHAMVLLDIRNSRMKYFYDIWYMANTWEFEMKPRRKRSSFHSHDAARHCQKTFLLLSQTGFSMTPKRKCSGTHSSAVWMPVTSDQLWRKSARFFETFCCPAFQENHNNQVCAGIQLTIGAENG